MDNRRHSERIPVELTARYHTAAGGVEHCRITSISREGTRIFLHTKEVLSVGQELKLSIDIPLDEKTIDGTFRPRWIKEKKNGSEYTCESGGLLSLATAEDRHTLLKYVVSISLVKLNLGCLE